MNGNKTDSGIAAAAKKLRRAVPAVMAVIAAVMFSACGASVSTKLEADVQFKGTRTITAVLSNGDLNEEVVGGAEAIEMVVKKYIPDVLSYSSKAGDSDLTYTFTFTFDGIDDYRSKVETIFNACPENTFVPEISYNYIDSPFRQKLYFNENFNSIDMLSWLKYGLRTEKVVSYSSESDWFESGSSKIVFNGTEYDSGSSLNADYEEQTRPYEINVITNVNNDSSLDRIYKFRFSSAAVEKFASESRDIDGYFSSLSSLAQMTKTEDEEGNVDYILEEKNLDVQTVKAETAKILQDEDAKFNVVISEYVPEGENDKRKNCDIQFAVTELSNFRYYTDDAYDITYNYYFPDDVVVLKYLNCDAYAHKDDSGRSYVGMKRDDYGDESVFTACWDVKFTKAAAELSFSGDNPELTAMLYLPSDIMEMAKTPVKAKLEKAVADGIEFTENIVSETVEIPAETDETAGSEVTSDSEETVETLETAADTAETVTNEYIEYRLKMSGGNSEEVAKRYKNFIYNYTGKKIECSFGNEKGFSGSPFKTMSSYSAEFDMTPLSEGEEVYITYNKAPGEKIFVTENCSFRADAKQADDSKLTGVSQSMVRFIAVTESVNFIGIILTVAAAAAGIAFIIIAAANGKSWIAVIKKQAAAVPKFTPPVNTSAAPSNTNAEPAKDLREPVYSGAKAAQTPSDNENGDDEEEFI